jgi:predicted adenine nucleotide alpha hydrolase (AANH) superfamily ATPase
MSVNYQLILDKEIEKNTQSGKRPSLLLHVCCAPCSSYVLEYLSKHFEITVYFYNPNISPDDEYYKRADEVLRLVKEMDLQNVSVVTEKYDPYEFENMSKGLENEPERGARCVKCYRLRLEKSAVYAQSNRFDYFTSTLTISPLKRADVLNEIGGDLARKYGVSYLFSDFKKREGYKRSIELSTKYGLYRQNYCGCKYSRRDD